ncbi:MAG: alanine dehydrogenase [Nitrospiria bacterium]
MIIGIPKEVKDQEYRVSMTPAGTSALVRRGHTVLVESGAGVGSGLNDDVYDRSGAEILSSKEGLFERADLILKVKEPIPGEFELFKREQVLFTFLHLAANQALLRFLLECSVTAIAYETIELDNGSHPILKPMSEVAGRMSVILGANHLQKNRGGSGLLLSGIPGVRKGRVTVIGGGVVGKNAAMVALALGAEVTVIERHSPQRTYLDDFFKGRIAILPSHPESVSEALEQSDLAIGAASMTGDIAPHLVTREMVHKMEKGSVIVDVSIDQGGCFETSRPTSQSNPVYDVDGVIHYCVSNIPGTLPRTATFALANETLPYLQRIAEMGFKNAMDSDPALARGVNTHGGKIVHPTVAKAFKAAAISK